VTVRKSPIRYPGGKSRALKVLAANFPKSIDEYREPFVGGASVAFMVSSMHPEATIWVNDIFEPLVCFWRTLQEPGSATKLVERLLQEHAASTTELKARKLFSRAVRDMNDATKSAEDWACAFYIYNRLSFSGASCSTSCSAENFGRWRSAEVRIRDLITWTPLLKNWHISCGGYEDLLSAPWTGMAPLLFLDPPYDVQADHLYGNRGDTHRGFDHGRFRELAEDADVPTVVTYNEGMFARFDNWPTRKRWKLGYSIVSGPTYRRLQKSRRELLAANYSVAAPNQEIVSGFMQPSAMSPEELRAIMKKLGLTQVRLAQALGITDRTVRHWVSGQREIPSATVMAVNSLASKKRKPSPAPRLRRKKPIAQTFCDDRLKLFHGDSLEILKTFSSNTFDSVVCDPPYGIDFLESHWDGRDTIAFSRLFWIEALRVLKPGGHLAAMGAPRTSHRLVCAIEDSGFEIRDSLIWLHSQGFPKGRAGEHASNLKSAHEPICLARKPLSANSTANNAGDWDTVPLDIETCHIEAPDHARFAQNRARDEIHDTEGGKYIGVQSPIPNVYGAPDGRCPAYVVLDGSAAVVDVLPEGADRFFYCAKASTTDRAGTSHPTVKPVALMEWLVTLVTPVGGHLLDPFAGSGTTGQSALNKGFSATLIEREEQFLADIVRRFEGDHWDTRVATEQVDKYPEDFTVQVADADGF
jgi:site-specific DNA-methyltransferase (adenine-specific)